MACGKGSCSGCDCGESSSPAPIDGRSVPGDYKSTARPGKSRESFGIWGESKKEVTKYPEKTVYILRGLPGSGKSKIAKSIKGSVSVSVDDFFARWVNDYKFDPAKIGEAHDQCMRNFLRAVDTEREHVVVDNANLHAYECSPYVMVARAKHYKVVIINVICDPEIAFKRQIHGVSKEDHCEMAKTFESEILPEWWEVENVNGEC